MVDPLLAALSDLADPAPASLPDRVLDGWLSAPSPLGDVFVVVGAAGVRYVRTAAFVGDDPEAFLAAYRDRFDRPVRARSRPVRGLRPGLAGRGPGPELDLAACTPFERAVLAATARIPTGQTRPYGWVAREAGHPAAVRAAGTALARNPVPLLVPCHRVTRADGTAGQYLSGAADKLALLRAEGADPVAVAELAAAGVHLVGSDTTGIVCFPTCHHARRIATAHRRGFRSLVGATGAGYRPCRDCRPGPSARV